MAHTKSHKSRAKKRENAQVISTGLALRYDRQRPPAARAMDASRRSKIVHDKPTIGWAKHPEKSDVKNIDDGSKRAKHRTKHVMKQHFRNIGLIGAAVTNAQVAERDLEQRMNSLKYLTDKNGNPKANLSKDEQWHLKRINKQIEKDRKIILRVKHVLPKVREIQQDIRDVKKAIKTKGPYSYEAEHRLPELEERLDKQLFYLKSEKKRYPKRDR